MSREERSPIPENNLPKYLNERSVKAYRDRQAGRLSVTPAEQKEALAAMTCLTPTSETTRREFGKVLTVSGKDHYQAVARGVGTSIDWLLEYAKALRIIGRYEESNLIHSQAIDAIGGCENENVLDELEEKYSGRDDIRVAVAKGRLRARQASEKHDKKHDYK